MTPATASPAQRPVSSSEPVPATSTCVTEGQAGGVSSGSLSLCGWTPAQLTPVGCVDLLKLSLCSLRELSPRCPVPPTSPASQALSDNRTPPMRTMVCQKLLDFVHVFPFNPSKALKERDGVLTIEDLCPVLRSPRWPCPLHSSQQRSGVPSSASSPGTGCLLSSGSRPF